METKIEDCQQEVYALATRDFGSAIRALKNGYKVAREGWNGKGMFIYLNKGSYPCDSKHNDNDFNRTGGIPKELFELGDAGTTIRTPNINMWTAQNTVVTGWLASQTDMLAEDWTVVNN